MLRFGVTLAGLLLLGGVSFAAEPVALPADGSTADVQGVDWSGFHLGILGGYAGHSTSTRLQSVEGFLLEADVANGTLPTTVSGSVGGALLGLGAGFDQQFGRFVLGLAGDVAWANAAGAAEFRAIDPGTPFAPIFAGQETVTTFSSRLENLATARIRAGVAADKALFYVTAGLAAGSVANKFQLAVPGLGQSYGPWSDSGLLWGYTAGAGVEYAVTETVTAKLEYLYYDLSDRDVRATHAAFPGQQITYGFLNNGSVVRAGLNFKF